METKKLVQQVKRGNIFAVFLLAEKMGKKAIKKKMKKYKADCKKNAELLRSMRPGRA